MTTRIRIQGPNFNLVDRQVKLVVNGKWKYYLFFTCFGILEGYKRRHENDFDRIKYDEMRGMFSNLLLENDARIFELAELILKNMLKYFNVSSKVDFRGLWMKFLIEAIQKVFKKQDEVMETFFKHKIDVLFAWSLFPGRECLETRLESLISKYNSTLDQPYLPKDELKLFKELLDIARETFISTLKYS